MGQHQRIRENALGLPRGKTSEETVYFIGSRVMSAKRYGTVLRSHWGIENGCHWHLDMTFREDANRTRDRNAGANLGVIRRVSASLLKQDPGKGSIKGKRLTDALDPNYLLKVLNGFQAN